MSDFFQRLSARAIGAQAALPLASLRTGSPLARDDQRLHGAGLTGVPLFDDAPAVEGDVPLATPLPASATPAVLAPLTPAPRSVPRAEFLAGPAAPVPRPDSYPLTPVFTTRETVRVQSLVVTTPERESVDPVATSPAVEAQVPRAEPVSSVSDLMDQLGSWLRDEREPSAREPTLLPRATPASVEPAALLVPALAAAPSVQAPEPPPPRLTIGRLHVEVVVAPAATPLQRPAAPVPAPAAAARISAPFPRHVFGQRQR